eukprot:474067-Rhodomonas_salina.1
MEGKHVHIRLLENDFLKKAGWCPVKWLVSVNDNHGCEEHNNANESEDRHPPKKQAIHLSSHYARGLLLCNFFAVTAACAAAWHYFYWPPLVVAPPRCPPPPALQHPIL